MSENNPENALAYAQRICQEFAIKADRKKRSSKALFALILINSLSAPLFIAYGGTCKFTAQIIPSILSVLAAGITSWVQIRTPQKLWSIYRSAQRTIEVEVMKYKFQIDEYSSSKVSEQLLVKRVSEVALNTHNEWTAMVPNPSFASISSTVAK
ncbi:DUF4231 domain-containing protein [Hymenobacter cheonanensis]|uniref:DUF4231 domain-containing protein n=1 Tax=Hymenobacter sp. CA2-7 TaxID=3063993 RepID=UPI0027133F12|nr:DUF4231 domain-containing protein [Hymenobacter sp. CA2-7]MDO7887606.1 DUF4231 domain-containing protein [Hymenobacter sp. CA2-7]